MFKRSVLVFSVILLLSTCSLAAETHEKGGGGYFHRISFIKLDQFNDELKKEGLDEFSNTVTLYGGGGYGYSPGGKWRFGGYGFGGGDVKEKADKTEEASFGIGYGCLSVDYVVLLKRSSELCFGAGLGYGSAGFGIQKKTNDASFPWQYRQIDNTFAVFEPQVSLNVICQTARAYLPTRLELATSYFIPFAQWSNREGDFSTLSDDKLDLRHFAAQIRFIWGEF